MRHAGWLLIAIACVACKGRHEPKPVEGSGGGSGSAAPAPKAGPVYEPGRLYAESEITSLLDDVHARLAANAKRACPGPKVMASAAGPSAPAIAELIEGAGDIAPCMTKLDELAKTEGLKDVIAKGGAPVAEIQAACGLPVAAKVLAAAAAEVGCSPYVVGVKAEPKTLIRGIYAAHVIALHARALASKGKLDEAVQLSVAALRVFQDLTRGRVTMITAMIAVASIEIVGANLDTLLAGGKLDAKVRDEAIAGLDAMIYAMPKWSEIQAGERDSMDIYFGAAKLMPKDWVPPGGWNEDLRQTQQSPEPGAPFANPRDEAAMLLVVSKLNAEDWAKACPDGATFAVCRAGYAKLAAEAKPKPQDNLKALYQELADSAAKGNTDAVREKIRGAVVDILKSVAQPAFEKYPIKMAGALARLAELRMHLEVLRAGCVPANLLAKLASPEGLGDAMTLTVAAGKVEIGPPAWAAAPAPWSFPCAN